MKSRWLINLALLVLVVALGAFVYLRPEPGQQKQSGYALSAHKLASFSKLSIESPAKAPVTFEKINDLWRITQPYKARADSVAVQRVLSIVAAISADKFPATDLARFGLESPKLKLKLDSEVFLFGTINPVSGDQYVAYKDAVYLLSAGYSEAASIQLVEFIDKSPLKPTEEIIGFDFSRLEQWEDVRLNVDLLKGQWKISVANAKPNQNEMNEWLDVAWAHASANAVEPYVPDRKTTFPSFEIKMKDGSKVHFDKLQESPELQLGRPDEGMIYHFAADMGFSMLNPPINVAK